MLTAHRHTRLGPSDRPLWRVACCSIKARDVGQLIFDKANEPSVIVKDIDLADSVTFEKQSCRGVSAVGLKRDGTER